MLLAKWPSCLLNECSYVLSLSLNDIFYSWLHTPTFAFLILFYFIFFVLFLAVSLSEDVAGSPYDKESMAIIHLNNTTVMYLKEVTKFLALVCFLREESFERKGEQLNSANTYIIN